MAASPKRIVRKGRVYQLTVAAVDYRAFIWQASGGFCGRVEEMPQIEPCRGRSVPAVRDLLCAALARTEPAELAAPEPARSQEEERSMRKRIIGSQPDAESPATPAWIDLETLIQIEVSSEEPGYPIEAALGGIASPGWRAAQPGPQTVRLTFDQPQHLRRIRLVFDEDSQPRTQEFALRWSADQGVSYHDVLRQQYTFSPPGTVKEVEEYEVDLPAVTIVVLQIVPDISGGLAHATLTALRLA